MARTINFNGKPVTLIGRSLLKGRRAPDFRITTQDMQEMTLSHYDGKIKILTSFISLDTSVCDLQVKEFNKRATSLAADIAIVGISKDLPFAQKRFCETFHISNVTVASDYRYSSFGINYGLLIKELNLLARSVSIVDKNNVLRYLQIVPEGTDPPDYDDVLKNLDEIRKNPALAIKEDLPGKCKPCEGGTPSLPPETINRMMVRHPGWTLLEGKRISREFKFKDFIDAMYFVDLLAVIAEEQGHHPDITIYYNRVHIALTTHAARGLTDNDFIMARIIDEL